MKKQLFSILAGGACLFFSACRSVTPVEEYYIYDCSKNQMNLMLDSKQIISEKERENNVRLLLEETGLAGEYQKMLDASGNVVRRFVCVIDENERLQWGFSKHDNLDNAARLIRNIGDTAQKRRMAESLVALWMKGADYSTLKLYENALKEQRPQCCVVHENFEKKSDTPAAIREGFYIFEKNGRKEFIRHGLSREFNMNGSLRQESIWENGKLRKIIFELKNGGKE